MDREFSVEEINDQFWAGHPQNRLGKEEDGAAKPSSSLTSAAALQNTMRMNRSSSEWAFQRFLQEATAPDLFDTTSVLSSLTPRHPPGDDDDVVEIKGNHHHTGGAVVDNHNQLSRIAAVGGPSPHIPVDTDDYQAFLKSRLELACAAVALTRSSNGKAQDYVAAVSANGSQASNSSQLGSHVTFKASSGHDTSNIEYKDAGGPVNVPPAPITAQKLGTQVKSTSSGSSVEQSDDDEAEGENETSQNMDSADAKRMRRMLSNRESARRSRRRKQAHLSELETQVSQVKVEHSSLLKRLTDINHKYNEAAVDNRVLKADVETLRAKVKMAEETVKRVTGLNPLFQAMSDISLMSVPSFAGSPLDTSGDAAVPVQHNLKQHYHNVPSNNNIFAQDHCIQDGLVGIPPMENVRRNETVSSNGANRAVSMHRVASLEHLQKRIAGSSSSQGAGKQQTRLG